jgi:hypothetical protein
MDMARWSRYGLGVVVLLLVASVLAFAPGVLAQEQAADEPGLGASISGFMQSTAVDADESVESGMWEQRFETETAPDRAVERRAAALRDRLTALEERSAELETSRQDGTLTGVSYTARASAVHAQLANLRSTIERTADNAQRRGVDTAALDELRGSAETAAGPEVSAVARDIANAGRGPPGDAPGRGDRAGTPGPPTERGPPEDGGTADGPPEDPGNGDGGPPDDAGSGDRGNGDGGEPADPGNDDRGNGDGGAPDDAGTSGQESGGQSDHAGSDDGSNGNAGGGNQSDETGSDHGADGNAGGDTGSSKGQGNPANG